MKMKTKFLLLIILCFSIFSNTYALQTTQNEYFYCPQRIDYQNKQWQITTCDKTGHCQADHRGIFDQYFNAPSINLTNNHTYLLDSVSSTFHSSAANNSCNYSETPNRTNVVILEIKPEANLEASINGSTNWRFPDVTCNENLSNNDWHLHPHLNCPLKNRLGFVAHNLNITNGIVLQSNEITLTTDNIPMTQYKAVTDEAALYACGNVEQCTIDIQSSKGLKYGSVVIDLVTMKILKIIQLLPMKVQIKKTEPFNSIEVSYTVSSLKP